MAKGDDIVRRKKNKLNRKKLHQQKDSSAKVSARVASLIAAKKRQLHQQKDSSAKVSARVASLIAAKKRRKSGHRSMCQGMCFSLPTPQDPYNDRHSKKETKSSDPLKVKEWGIVKCKTAPQRHETKHEKGRENGLKHTTKTNSLKQIGDVDLGKTDIQMDGEVDDCIQRQTLENLDCPSKFLIMCLNAIEAEFQNTSSYKSEDKPLYVNSWGVEFLKCYAMGNDILDMSGGASTIEQIAWMASTAADSIARQEKEGLSFHSPFLLFLVPSQEKGSKARSVCKPLKALGIHTVSLHSGASLEHQIHGLRSCEPEFLVSTPERLLELVSVNAVDISGVSLLVIDGIEASSETSILDDIKTIKGYISGNHLTVVFKDCTGSSSTALHNILSKPFSKLSLSNSPPRIADCVC